MVTDGNWFKSTADVTQDFFSVRVLNCWNSLPQSAVQVNTVNCFKNQLEKLGNTQMDFFSWTISPLNPLAADLKSWTGQLVISRDSTVVQTHR